jgi:hypothetical protein
VEAARLAADAVALARVEHGLERLGRALQSRQHAGGVVEGDVVVGHAVEQQQATLEVRQPRDHVGGL